jgi:hypothetical protein
MSTPNPGLPRSDPRCSLLVIPGLRPDPKEPRDQLDLLVNIDPSLRVVEVNVDATTYNGPLPTFQATEDFRAAYGEAWRFTVDLRRGVTSLLDGGAIPFIPASRTTSLGGLRPGCSSATVCRWRRWRRSPATSSTRTPRAHCACDLVLDPAGSGPFGDHSTFSASTDG